MKSGKRYSNEQILKGIKLHDKDVLNYIYQAYFDKVSWFILSNSGDRTVVYDVFQDALMAIYTRLTNSSLELTGSSFETYFIGTCKHLWLMELRNRSKIARPVEISEDVASYDSSDEMSYDDERIARVVHESFLKLSKECQQLIMLKENGHSYEEITRIMDINSEEFARVKKHRCKEYLVELVRNHPKY